MDTVDSVAPPAKRRGLDRSRLIISLLIAVAVGASVWGFSLAQHGEQDLAIKDAAVENVFPKPGNLVQPQTGIVVDLAPGYRGELVINGQLIPTYDVTNANTATTNVNQPALDTQFDLANNQLTFLPQKGATIEKLPAGNVRATVSFWKIGEAPETARSVSWTFRVGA